MRDEKQAALEGEVLDESAPDPEAADVTPGWVGRNRGRIEQGRRIGLALMPLAPPPARLALAAATVAADGLLLADDIKRRQVDAAAGGAKVGALVLEGLALAAMSRFAPARLAGNLAGIQAARSALDRATWVLDGTGPGTWSGR